MSSPLVIAIVLNFGHCEDTLACLASLEQSTYANLRVMVLDGQSTDGSVAAVRARFPAMMVIELPDNRGYAGNNNIGIEAALGQGADWVFVLNEDATIAPDCIARLVDVGESDACIGIVGPMVYHANEPYVIQSAGGRIDRHFRTWHRGMNEADQGQFVRPAVVDWISGCGILVRRAVIEQVGTIDDRFFAYVEELEWCVRAARAGWKIVHVPKACMWHKGVQRNYQPKPAFTYYTTRNHLLLMQKHGAPAAAWLVTGGQILRTLSSWSFKPKWRAKRQHRDAMWRGVVDFVSHRWGQMP
jgi:GT2 family glycosyltransferase